LLNLAAPTDPAWTGRALAHLDEILLDHAHCEKKAAATALGLIFRYPEQPALMAPLSRLAREELAHFEEVLRHLEARGTPFCRLPPSPYAAQLTAAIRTHEPAKLLDTLICCALIEARSCERMKLLAEALDGRGDEPALRDLYRGLLQSEARHHQSYLDLAELVYPGPRAEVRDRLRALALHEARVLSQAPPLPPRLHNA
jgi:tRNA-(ms[2]io[6]A)-hydroxylase